MVCPNEKNIGEKHREKLTKYQQLAFEMREKRPEYRVEIVPIVTGCLGGGMKQVYIILIYSKYNIIIIYIILIYNKSIYNINV